MKRGISQMDKQPNEARFCCVICLELLKNPVTIPCGHSYCMDCIETHWTGEAQRKICSCPQCRKIFTPRPTLVKNFLLADLLEELRKSGHEVAPSSDHIFDKTENVACNFCSEKNVKAIKSCLICLASFCEEHLKPHYSKDSLKNHKLVEPFKNLKQNICTLHNELMNMFCRTDQRCICDVCAVEDHKHHQTVTAADERTERLKHLHESREEIQRKIREREREVRLLHHEVEAINHSADKTVAESMEILTELIRLIKQKISDLTLDVRSMQQTKVDEVKELQRKLQEMIAELRRKDTELRQLSQTEDQNQFLLNYSPASTLSESASTPSITGRYLRYFTDVKPAVSQLKCKFKDLLKNRWAIIQSVISHVDVLLLPPVPKSRAEFLAYACDVTFDPNTAHKRLLLSNKNKKVTNTRGSNFHPDHPERFTGYCQQVLSEKSLPERCYWEVEISTGASVAVAYKSINRAEEQFGYGNEIKSWCLSAFMDRYSFHCSSVETSIPFPWYPKVGVYLDQKAGILCFYSVSETMTLLHRVQAAFTEPLYAGIAASFSGYSAELCKVQ